jgi:hypothetical protein
VMTDCVSALVYIDLQLSFIFKKRQDRPTREIGRKECESKDQASTNMKRGHLLAPPRVMNERTSVIYSC